MTTFVPELYFIHLFKMLIKFSQSVEWWYSIIWPKMNWICNLPLIHWVENLFNGVFQWLYFKKRSVSCTSHPVYSYNCHNHHTWCVLYRKCVNPSLPSAVLLKKFFRREKVVFTSIKESELDFPFPNLIKVMSRNCLTCGIKYLYRITSKSPFL